MQDRDQDDQPVGCSCAKDPFGALPPDVRPRPERETSLRKITCPGCGLNYWTNRETDFCMECDGAGTPER